MKPMFKQITIVFILLVSSGIVCGQTTSLGTEAKSGNQKSDVPLIKPLDPIGGPMSAKAMDQLGLTSGQKALLDESLDARKAVQAENVATREASYKTLTEQLSSSRFDPRAVIKQRQEARASIETRVDAVQQKWLLFWDSLSQTQRYTMVQYMRDQLTAQAKKQSR